MKLFLPLIAFLTILFVGCKTDAKKEAQKTNEEEQHVKNEPVQVQNFDSLNGYWLNKVVLDKLDEHISPFQLSSILRSEFLLKVEGSSTLNIMAMTSHEGSERVEYIFDQNSNRFTASKDSYEKIRFKGDLLERIHPLTQKSTFFKKIDLSFEDLLRQKLFTGNYLVEDERINLATNGKVKNFGKFKYYSVIYDFTEGIDFNAILFLENENDLMSKGELFHYNFNGNQLELQKVICDWENYDHSIDEHIKIWKKI